MIHHTSTKLNAAIKAVNKRYLAGKNDDDQVGKMCQLDKITKGFSFKPCDDTYELITDFEKLVFLSEKYGYWSEEVKRFNMVLDSKGGYNYLMELNNKIKK